MSINQFQSHLASTMDDFVAYKQVQGYSYQGSIKQLRAFDHFLTEQSFEQPYLTAQVAAEYFAHTQAFSPNTRQARLSTAREFSCYLHLLEPRSQIFQNPPARRQRLPRFYLFNDRELAMHADFRYPGWPVETTAELGFRVASIPEPGSITLLLCGLVTGLIWWRRRRKA